MNEKRPAKAGRFCVCLTAARYASSIDRFEFPSQYPSMGAEALTDPVAQAASARLVRGILDRVGGKWSAHVIHLLGSGTRRFGDLRRSMR